MLIYFYKEINSFATVSWSPVSLFFSHQSFFSLIKIAPPTAFFHRNLFIPLTDCLSNHGGHSKEPPEGPQDLFKAAPMPEPLGTQPDKKTSLVTVEAFPTELKEWGETEVPI